MKNKKHIRDFFITGVYALGGVSVFRTLFLKKSPLVRVLVFHDVQDGEWFRSSIVYIKKNYRIVSPTDFYQGKFDSSKINVLISFDDGYASWVDICLPILKDEEVKALFFVNSGLIDVFGNVEMQSMYVQDRLKLFPRKTLSWEGVRTLRDEGHTIGGHTTTHARLSELQEEMQREDIRKDKSRIEKMTGTQIFAFAYPFGQENDFTKDTEKIAHELGYTHAFTTEGVFVNFDNLFRISRLCVEDLQSIRGLTQWIEGGYDIYHKMKSVCVR